MLEFRGMSSSTLETFPNPRPERDAIPSTGAQELRAPQQFFAASDRNRSASYTVSFRNRVCDNCSFNCRTHSMPFLPRRLMSANTTSGWSPRITARALSASRYSPTSWTSGARHKVSDQIHESLPTVRPLRHRERTATPTRRGFSRRAARNDRRHDAQFARPESDGFHRLLVARVG